MALKRNEFTADYEAFLEALADLGHFQQLIGWQLRLAKDSTARSIEVLAKQGHPSDAYFAANGMSIINIFHDGKLDIRAPYGKRVTKGEQLRPMAEEMERRFNSFLMVWVFELLEKYLMKLYGKLLFQIRNETALEFKQAFHSRKPKLAKMKGTPQYFEAYAEFAWNRDSKAVLEAFEKLTKWKRITYRAFHDMPWKEYIEVIAFCRHRIVHNDGRVTKNSLNTLSVGQQEYVRSCLHDSLYSPEKHLLPPTRFIDNLFEAVGSYVWAMYFLVSERSGMVDESMFFRPEDGGKRKVQPK
jgi:hypothetical protein